MPIKHLEIEVNGRVHMARHDFEMIDRLETRFTVWDLVRSSDNLRIRDVAWMLSCATGEDYKVIGDDCVSDWDGAKKAAMALVEAILLPASESAKKKQPEAPQA
jgi:hypothetical protein